MAIGFPAYHEQRVRYDGLDDRDLTGAIARAFKRLRWDWHRSDRWSYRASTGFRLLSWGETVRVELLGEGRLLVRSAYIVPWKWFDWWHNAENVRVFLRELDDVLDADVG